MPYLSAASRLVAPTRPPNFLPTRRLPTASVDPPASKQEAVKAAESSDTLSLSAPTAQAESTTINVGTLRVVMPSCESRCEAIADDDVIEGKPKKLDPPACSAEC